MKYYGMITSQMLKTSNIKIFYRYLVIVLICMPFLVLHSFISWSNSLSVLFVFKILVPFMGIGFGLFGMSTYLFDKFNLLNISISDLK